MYFNPNIPPTSSVTFMNLRTTATDLFLQTLKRVSVAETMQKQISCGNSILRIGDTSYFLRQFRRIVIIGMGKAAVSMFETLLPMIEPELDPNQTPEGILSCTVLPRRSDPRFQCFVGSHPIPSEHSISAAEAILNLLQRCDESCLVLFLLSGGASAMVEKPLDHSIPLAQMARFHRALVQSGLPITQINVLRKHFSAVKGGRLAIAAGGATQCTLLISDVPGNALHMVGSGPSLPDPSTVDECRSIIESNLAALELPERVREFFRGPALPETPKPGHRSFIKAQALSLLSSDDLCREASAIAAGLGFEVVIDNHCDDWDYRDAASYLLDRIIALQRKHPRICLLSAGEVAVKLGKEYG